jgi:hypothetical protein
MIEGEIQGRRCFPHSTNESRNLSTMVGAMIHHMEHDLPQWLLPLDLFEIAVSNFPGRRFARERLRPGAPTLVKFGPGGLQMGQRAVAICHRARERFALDASQPESLGEIKMNQRAENRIIGRLEIARQLLGRKLCRCIDQARAGPGGIRDVILKDCGGNRHFFLRLNDFLTQARNLMWGC